MGRRTNREIFESGLQPKSRGEGSVFKISVNGQEKWRATYTLFMDEKNRAVQVSGTGASKEEAIRRREENRQKRLVQRGSLPASALNAKKKDIGRTVSEALREWIDWKSRQTLRSRKISLNVQATYRTMIEKHIIPAIGGKNLRALSTGDCDKLINDTLLRKKKPDGTRLLGESRMRTLQLMFRSALDWCVDQKFIYENPMRGVPVLDKPRSSQSRQGLDKQFWVTYRLAANLKGHPDEARWLFTFLLAIRQSEKLGLTWDCFRNLTNKKSLATVEIKQQLDVHPETKRQYIRYETKTASGGRIIPLDDRLVAVINVYKKLQDEWKKSPEWQPLPELENLVFTTPVGKPIRHQQDNKHWKKMLEENRIPYMQQHTMRHLAISLMISDGHPIEIVRAIAGHSDEAITRAVYTHIDLKSKVEPMTGLVDRVFREREAKGKT